MEEREKGGKGKTRRGEGRHERHEGGGAGRRVRRGKQDKVRKEKDEDKNQVGEEPGKENEKGRERSRRRNRREGEREDGKGKWEGEVGRERRRILGKEGSLAAEMDSGREGRRERRKVRERLNHGEGRKGLVNSVGREQKRDKKGGSLS